VLDKDYHCSMNIEEFIRSRPDHTPTPYHGITNRLVVLCWIRMVIVVRMKMSSKEVIPTIILPHLPYHDRKVWGNTSQVTSSCTHMKQTRIERMAASNTLRITLVKYHCLLTGFVNKACLRITYASLLMGLL
jgi:hypothetical protein